MTPDHCPVAAANASHSETGSIDRIEHLLSGHVIHGHDDWWDGGGGRFCWSYGPAPMERDRVGILGIVRETGAAGVDAERDRVWRMLMKGTDDNWDAGTEPVCEHVAAPLESDHPGRLR